MSSVAFKFIGHWLGICDMIENLIIVVIVVVVSLASSVGCTIKLFKAVIVDTL
jgi:hypothetical protein